MGHCSCHTNWDCGKRDEADERKQLLTALLRERIRFNDQTVEHVKKSGRLQCYVVSEGSVLGSELIRKRDKETELCKKLLTEFE